MTASSPPVFSPVFSLAQRAIHWLMALLIIFNLIATDGMERAIRLLARGEAVSPEQYAAANIHAYVGIAILALAVLRLCLRFVQGVPPEPASEPPLLRLVGRVAHFTFYLLFFALPLSGIAAYYFGILPAGSVHGGPLKMLMWLLILVHVAAALVHQFWWKTDVLARMTHGRAR